MADQQSPGLLANILAVAGFIILIVIIVWGAYHLLRLTGNGVSSLFSQFNGGEEIEIDAPTAPVESGRSFPLAWEYDTETAGSYAFLYQCKPGFRFEATSPSGATAAVPCGNAFSVGSSTSVTLTPKLSGTSTLDVPVSVVFVPSGGTDVEERPQGTATIRVTAAATSAPSTSGPAAPSQPTPGTSGGTQPVATGPADLTVRILAAGVIDQYGTFVARAPMNPNEVAAIKFDIANNGKRATGAWTFSVQLPTSPSFAYNSPVQISLAPGAHIENTLRFRPIQSGGGTITILVDNGNAVAESNEGNNTASYFFNAGTWSGYPYMAPHVY